MAGRFTKGIQYATYQQRPMEELLFAPITMQAAHDKADTALNAMELDFDAFEGMDAERKKQIITKYENEQNKIASAMSNYGVSPGMAHNITNLVSRLENDQEIKAISNRSAEIKKRLDEERKLSASFKNPSDITEGVLNARRKELAKQETGYDKKTGSYNPVEVSGIVPHMDITNTVMALGKSVTPDAIMDIALSNNDITQEDYAKLKTAIRQRGVKLNSVEGLTFLLGKEGVGAEKLSKSIRTLLENNPGFKASWEQEQMARGFDKDEAKKYYENSIKGAIEALTNTKITTHPIKYGTSKSSRTGGGVGTQEASPGDAATVQTDIKQDLENVKETEKTAVAITKGDVKAEFRTPYEIKEGLSVKEAMNRLPLDSERRTKWEAANHLEAIERVNQMKNNSALILNKMGSTEKQNLLTGGATWGKIQRDEAKKAIDYFSDSNPELAALIETTLTTGVAGLTNVSVAENVIGKEFTFKKIGTDRRLGVDDALYMGSNPATMGSILLGPGLLSKDDVREDNDFPQLNERYPKWLEVETLIDNKVLNPTLTGTDKAMINIINGSFTTEEKFVAGDYLYNKYLPYLEASNSERDEMRLPLMAVEEDRRKLLKEDTGILDMNSREIISYSARDQKLSQVKQGLETLGGSVEVRTADMSERDANFDMKDIEGNVELSEGTATLIARGTKTEDGTSPASHIMIAPVIRREWNKIVGPRYAQEFNNILDEFEAQTIELNSSNYAHLTQEEKEAASIDIHNRFTDQMDKLGIGTGMSTVFKVSSNPAQIRTFITTARFHDGVPGNSRNFSNKSSTFLIKAASKILAEKINTYEESQGHKLQLVTTPKKDESGEETGGLTVSLFDPQANDGKGEVVLESNEYFNYYDALGDLELLALRGQL